MYLPFILYHYYGNKLISHSFNHTVFPSQFLVHTNPYKWHYTSPTISQFSLFIHVVHPVYVKLSVLLWGCKVHAISEWLVMLFLVTSFQLLTVHVAMMLPEQ